jgi:hypothetical protein
MKKGKEMKVKINEARSRERKLNQRIKKINKMK